MQSQEEKTPEWLDKVFLRKALRSYKRDDSIEVDDFMISTGFSEHFASTMFQCKVSFSSIESGEATLNVVIKAKPVNDGLKMNVVAGGPLFETEIRMYNETIPAIHQLFERNGLKVKFGPEVIYTTTTPFPIIILRDLSDEGFYSPRNPPNEFEDSKLIVQRLAQFHAASFYLAEYHEHDFTDYNYTIYQTEPVIKAFFQDTLLIFRDVLDTWEDYRQYLPQLDAFIKNVAAIGANCYVPNKPGQGFNVLNHGDFHSRNLLVKDNAEKRIEEFYFIDYQLNCYCSPAVDLSYISSMVKRDENGEIPFEELIMFYHQEFVKALKSVGYLKQPPTLLDLNCEILKHGRLIVVINICFIPFSFIDWSKMQAEDLMGDGSDKSKEFKRQLYNHPVCKAVIQKNLKSWIYKGWL